MFLFDLLWDAPKLDDQRRDESGPQNITPLQAKDARFPSDVWERLQTRLLDALGAGPNGWIADRDNRVEEDSPYLKLKGRTVGLAEALMQKVRFPEMGQRLTAEEEDTCLRIGRALEESWYINHAYRYYQGLPRGVWSRENYAVLMRCQAETQERKNRRDEYRLYRPSGDDISSYEEKETRVRLEYDSTGLLSIFAPRSRRAQFDCFERKWVSVDRGLRWLRRDDDDDPQHVFHLETEDTATLIVEVRYEKTIPNSPVWIRCGRRVVRVER
jgi:hypothetical protein